MSAKGSFKVNILKVFALLFAIISVIIAFISFFVSYSKLGKPMCIGAIVLGILAMILGIYCLIKKLKEVVGIKDSIMCIGMGLLGTVLGIVVLGSHI
jgi:hypothetical protein